MTSSNHAGYRRNQPGKASNYIQLYDGKPGRKVVLVGRVSISQQKLYGNDQGQMANLQAAVARTGAAVIKALEPYECPGWDPSWLSTATAIAKQHGAVLVAETTDRFIRSRVYTKTDQTPQASDVELRDLRRCTKGLTLMTLLDPDATNGQMRAYQTKRGIRFRAATKPGYKKDRYFQNRTKLRWCLITGISTRGLARFLKVPESTTRRWVRRFLAEHHR